MPETLLNNITRGVLDNLLEGCQVVSPDFVYLYVNEAVARHGRTTRDALLGRSMMQAYPGIEETEMFTVLRRCMTTRQPATMDNRFVHLDGSISFFELRFEPVPAGVAILSVDISKRKCAEIELRRVMRALATISRCNQTMVRASDERAFVRDVCDLIVTTGEYLAARLVLDDGELVAGAGLFALDERGEELATHEGLRALAARALRTNTPARAAAGDQPPSGWRELERAGVATCLVLPVGDGRELRGTLTIAAGVEPAFGDDELGVLNEVAADLAYGVLALRKRIAHTEAERSRRESEQRAANAQRLEAVGRLAGGIAHDFNNLLTVVLTSASYALSSLDDGHELRADMEAINEVGLRAAALTRQLLAFSRKQVLEATEIHLDEVVRNLEPLLSRTLGDHIQLEVATNASGSVLADRSQLEQVVLNLVVNARDAMTQGGTLRIETADVVLDESHSEKIGATRGRHVALSVSDTGQGMDEETRQQIFEPFFTTKAPAKGTGLGLATVYGIIKQSGGNIQVTSAPGRGTTFEIYLPRLDRARSEPRRPPERSAGVPRGGETILLVEDDDGVRRAAERILREAGYRVLSACDGKAALAARAAHTGTLHMLLTDVSMPGVTGVALARELLVHDPGLAVLYTSGFANGFGDEHQALEAGAHYLVKPYTDVALTDKVREVLDVTASTTRG